jgi:glyoxylase-like metal-dependent hydrolase (beta-lactamase superfamily II)
MPTSINRFLLASIAASAFGGVAATSVERAAGPFDYETKEIAPNVYGFFEKRLNPIVSSNIIAVIGDDAVLVFDTGHHPSITRQILSDLRRLTPKPVKFVVVSHWHDDHWAGNGDVARAFPGVRVIAHEFTAKMLEARSKDFRGEACRKDVSDQLPSLKQRLENGKLPDGTPLPDATRQRLTNFVEALEGQVPECDAMVYRGVDQRMNDNLTIDLGGRRVELEFLGRGNTAGDIVALLPDSRTLLVGDLVVAPFPFATQSYISEWSKVLRKIEAMDLEQIVPGHGPILTDKQYVRDVAETLESIERQARAAYKPGMTADSLRAKIDLSELGERFAKGDRFIRANFDAQMKGSAIDRMWQELVGQSKPEG